MSRHQLSLMELVELSACRSLFHRCALLLLTIGVALSLAACTSRSAFVKQSEEVAAIIGEVQQAHQDAADRTTDRYRGKQCGYSDLAKAEAELAFAQYEAKKGDILRSGRHLRAARELAIEARSKAKAWDKDKNLLCLPPDRDRDGVLDDDDQCPDDPEDLDKFMDQDGCPDPDNDQDGIPDEKDKCPNDPEDLDGFQDEDGCPEPDNDNDGIADLKDQCPNDPEDIDGFEDDDGCPDADNDRDGLCDPWVVKNNLAEKYAGYCTGADACPLEAETFNGFEDEDGCPERDSDGDGIIDAKDACPQDPETFNGFDDDDGCPDEIPTKKYTYIVVTETRIELKQKIFFATDSDRIESKSFPLLNEVVDALAENTAINVRIEGHTDIRGSRAHNVDLSQRRAKSVRQYLISKGIAADRLQSEGYGPDRPIAPNKTKRGRDMNRRVEFHIDRAGAQPSMTTPAPALPAIQDVPLIPPPTEPRPSPDPGADEIPLLQPIAPSTGS